MAESFKVQSPFFPLTTPIIRNLILFGKQALSGFQVLFYFNPKPNLHNLKVLWVNMEAYEMPLTKLIKINLRRIPNENVLLKMYFREQ